MSNNIQLPAEKIQALNKLKQLPVECQNEIAAFAGDQIKNLETNSRDGFSFYCGALAGLTAGCAEYATKLHQVEQERDQLKGELDTAIRANENLTSRMQGWQQQLYGAQKERDTARALLEKFISRHEAGLLPDRFIYEEIKTFLDGK